MNYAQSNKLLIGIESIQINNMLVVVISQEFTEEPQKSAVNQAIMQQYKAVMTLCILLCLSFPSDII